MFSIKKERKKKKRLEQKSELVPLTKKDWKLRCREARSREFFKVRRRAETGKI